MQLISATKQSSLNMHKDNIRGIWKVDNYIWWLQHKNIPGVGKEKFFIMDGIEKLITEWIKVRINGKYYIDLAGVKCINLDMFAE